MAGADIYAGTWVTYIGGRATSLRIRRCQVDIVAGCDAKASHVFESSVIRIGGKRVNDLALSDPKVSGIHLEICLDEKGYRLRDLGSTNGTYVNGMRIVDIWLAPGTIIQLGDTQLVFQPLRESVEHTLSARDRFGGWIGRSPVARELFARLERIAPSEATVLITGETGTGKDVIATAIHDNSPRADKPFVVLDCGAISANLIESELFGHQRGAFTGAQSDRKGAFEQADGGTLFLDELGELPIDLQPKLLRAIERKQVRRVGGNTVISADVRIIAATNRDLAQEVGRGQFREDLFYRLAVASIHLPPLRQRKEDIVPLIDHFLAITPGGAKIKLRQRTIDLMRKHDWPGNVRELRNMVERAVFLSEVPDSTTQLHRGHPIASGGGNAQAVSSAGVAPAAPSAPAAPAIDIDVPFKLAKRATIDHFEREYVSLLLDRHSGNVSAAARAAGLDRMTLYRIIQRFGLRD